MTWALAIIGRIPLAGWLALAAAALLGINRVQAVRLHASQARAEQAVSVAEAQAQARRQDTEAADRAHAAANRYVARVAKAAAAGASTAGTLSRVRDAIAASPACPSAAAPGSPDATAPLRAVLGTCTAALADLGRDAQADADKVIGLQEHITATKTKDKQ